MATRTPGKFSYFIDGQEVYFINSDDSRLRISTSEPEAVITATGAVEPDTGSAEFAGQPVERSTGLKLNGFAPDVSQTTPLAPEPDTGAVSLDGFAPSISGIVFPDTGTLTIDGQKVNAAIPSVALSFSTTSPSTDLMISPTTRAVALAGQFVERLTGLKLDTSTVTLDWGIAATPTTRGVELAGIKPDVSNVAAGDHAPIPETGSVTIAETSPAPVHAHTITSSIDALAFSSDAPNTDPVAYPATRIVDIREFAPTVEGDEGAPGVVIEGPFNYGTRIRNPNAEEDAGNRYNICSRTGYRAKPGELVKDAYGELVRADSQDELHPADMPHKSRPERHKGPLRPSDIGAETFIDPDNPIDPDDY
jgi:hypothetical protein